MKRVALKVLYWVVVLLVSLAILIALIMFLESRDNSSVGGGNGGTPDAAISLRLWS